jgi:uncharacterized protein YbaR (Trm112 family)
MSEIELDICPVCPVCKEILRTERHKDIYCENCGYPVEDYNGVYLYPKLGEQLGDLQPDLQFYNGKEWVQSGLIRGRYTASFYGLYRKLITNKKESEV